jgi:hypothetical protein
MKKYSIWIALGIMMISYLSSCSELLEKVPIEPPLKDSTYINANAASTVPQLRKVFLEDFTGVKCNNCPRGQLAVADMIAATPDRIVAVAVHAGGLASPYDGDISLPITKGEELYVYFGSPNQPSATIDRIQNPADNSYTFVDAFWKPQVNTRLTVAPNVNIVSSIIKDPTESFYRHHIEVEFLADYTHEILITSGVTESGLITKQKSGTTTLDNYEQNHVLRSINTATQGTFVNFTDTKMYKKGRVLVKEYKIVADPKWNLSNCHAYCVVSDNVTRTVLQSDEVKLK